MTNSKKIVYRSIVLIIVSIAMAFLFSPLLQRNLYDDIRSLFLYKREFLWQFRYDWGLGLKSFDSIRFVKVEMLTVFFVFVGFIFVVGKNRYYDILYRYRWLIGLFVLFFLVVNKVNGDSLPIIGTYGLSDFTELGKFANPIYGEVRPIRTDEYIVSSPILLNSLINDTYFSSMGVLNYITNPAMIIARVINIFGIEYIYSFLWFYKTIFGILFSFEFFMLLTNKKKKISIVCTMMIYLSSFYLWWGLPPHVSYMQAAIVTADKFINNKEKIKRIIWLYLTGILVYGFATDLYPAWQVPYGYIGLCLLVWLIYKNWDKIKEFGKFEYILLAIAFVGAIVAAVIFVYSSMDYIQTIMNSEYPGHRIDYGGDSGFVNKIYCYLVNTLFAFKDYNVSNNSEMSAFISFFPIPTIILWVRLIRNKKKDILSILLTVVMCFIFIYCYIGLPQIVGTLILMKYSTVFRAIDMVGYIQILFLAIYFSYENDENIISTKIKIIEFVLSIILTIIVVNKCISIQNGYLNNWEMIILSLLFGIIIFLMCFKYVRNRYNILMSLIAFVCLLTGIYVRPIVIGLDSIYSRPVYSDIREIVENDDNGKWIALDGDYVSSYMTACGADVINMVNTSPNLELWSKVDEDGEYLYEYNRFAHIFITFTDDETSFYTDPSIQDSFTLFLSYKDICKLDVSYIASINDMSGIDNQYVKFEEISDDDTIKLYRINYK